MPTQATHQVRLAVHAALVIATLGCGDRRGTPITDQGQTGSLTLELRIDGRSENLPSIWSVAVADDGTIGLTSFHDGLIRYYSASGEPLGTLGGKGEFSAFSGIGWMADTLWIWDVQQQQISLVTPARTIARTIPFPGRGARPRREDVGRIPDFISSYPVALYPDGSTAASLTADETPPVPEGFYPARTVIGRVGPEGELESILARLPVAEGGTVSSGTGMTDIPFTNSAAWDVSPDGGIVAQAMAHTRGSAAGTLMVEATAADGGTRFSRSFPLELDSISQLVRDSTIAERVADLTPRSPGLAAALQGAVVPDIYPPLEAPPRGRALRVGRDSTLWVQLRLQQNGRPIVVLEPNGDVRGTLFLPVYARIGAAERGRIWVIERDSADVESLILYNVSWEDRP